MLELFLQKLVKKTYETGSLKSQKKKYNSLNDFALLTSNVMPPNLKPSKRRGLDRDDSLKSQFSTEKL